MNLRHLRNFWTVARMGGVARAAERLDLTPQTVSGQVRQLEEDLGVALFRPAGRGLELTEAGRMLASQGRDLLVASVILAENVRQVGGEMIERYQLGYAPDRWDGLIGKLGKGPERVKLLAAAGLLSQRDNGQSYDKFRDRVMFPIHDRRGRPIAFGGRILDAGEPKYLNSPETALFHKGRELYGLWQARQSAQKLKRLVVVEGYMDVIALAQHGVDEAVATLGTATTKEHAELLFRNAEDVVFCFDGDRAGRQAAWRALESTLPRLTDGRQAYFLFLPDGEDPDTLVRKEGSEGFRRRMHEAMPLSDYFFDTLAAEIDMQSLDGRARLSSRAQPLIEQMPDGAFRDLMARWKAAGAAPREVDDALWAEFRGLQDQFFNARQATLSEQDAEFRTNLEAKEALLAQAEAEVVPVRDLAASRAAFRSFLDAYNAHGKVPRESIRGLDNRVRALETAIRNAEDAEWKRTDPEARSRAEETVAMLSNEIDKLTEKIVKAEARGDNRAADKARDSIATYQTWLDQARETLADFSR